ncbi:hypothetical protein E1258_13195 [Micromonospora sp. KC207]|uniref:hypothetical protein n=1 Tax=Micromonospora sp. KC207 TaxID=2530377 RepID=UPI00104679D4|nr:hypothetical protein [Micromonospora sp. KC207]TDC60925.1 hypothetical protein E1258_13195 [Micromonospora sp. KC207]
MILKALHDFNTTAEPILAAMIERAHAQRDTTNHDRRAELTTIAHQITTTDAAITRYHTAFENGTMDDATAGPPHPRTPPTTDPTPHPARRTRGRPRHPTHTAATRHHHPDPRPPHHHHDQRHRHRTQGSHRTLIVEVRLTDQGVVPVFKIPTDTTMPPPNPDGGTHDEQPPVRTMVRLVGRLGLEPRT